MAWTIFRRSIRPTRGTDSNPLLFGVVVECNTSTRAPGPPYATRVAAGRTAYQIKMPGSLAEGYCCGSRAFGFRELCVGRAPGSGVRAVGKWPAVATAKSLAEAGHLSTAVVIADLR